MAEQKQGGFVPPGPNIVMLEVECDLLQKLVADPSRDMSGDHYTDGVFVRKATADFPAHVTLCNRYPIDELGTFSEDERDVVDHCLGAFANISCPKGEFIVFEQKFEKAKGAPADAEYDCVVFRLFPKGEAGAFQEMRDLLHGKFGTKIDYPEMQVHAFSEYFKKGLGKGVAEYRNEKLKALGVPVFTATRLLLKKHRGPQLDEWNLRTRVLSV
jgi:hypothetical protein